MKVLWFTNSPSLAKKRLNQLSYGGGWMESLQEKFQASKDIELGVSFYSRANEKTFSYNGTEYFIIKPSKPKGRIGKYLSRINHKLENEQEEIDKYLEIINEFKPDIIHIFGTEYPFGLISDKVNIPVLIWIQGVICVYTHKWFSGISEMDLARFGDRKLKLQGYGPYHDFRKMQKISDREIKIFKSCKYFLGRTDFDRRIVKVLAPQSKYIHCEEMLRAPFYKNEWKDPNNDDFILLSTLNTNFYKGFETIYETQEMLSKLPGRKIRWKIIGSQGDEEIFRMIENKYRHSASKLGIEFLGRKFADDLIHEMLNANVFIHTSHIDNSPNSVCEAMILGMPVISTNVGGIPSLLDNKKEGVLLQSGEPFSMAGSVMELADNYIQAIEYGKAARKRALVRHNEENIMHTLISIYSDIIKTK